MPSTILDQFGSPAVYSGGAYQGPRDERGLRIQHPYMFGDWAQLLGSGRWHVAVGDCRWVYSAFGLVNGAVEQRADYIVASGLRPVFEGEDDDFGDIVEDELEAADKVAGVRGPRFSTQEMFRLAVKACMVDGAIFLVPTESEFGFPMLQMIEAHRIGQRDDSKTTVESGRFKGARISCGIIYDRAGREIGYNVLGADPKGADDVQLDSSQMWHVARPRWASEGRPLPEIAPAILDLWDIREGREGAKQQIILDSHLTLIESNQSGRPDPMASIAFNPYGQSPGGADIQIMEKGAVRYIRNGNSITPFSTNRPSDQWQKFDQRITAAALYAIGWRAEMLDIATLGGSATRAFQDQINTTIYSGYNAILPYIVRWRQYQVAKLQKIGRLPANVEWYKLGCTPPPEFTCDPSRSVSSDIAAVEAGFESISRVHGRYGTTSKKELRAQARYYKQKRRIAEKEGIPESAFGNIGQQVSQ